MKKGKISLIVLFIAMALVLYFTLKDDFSGVIWELRNVNILIFIFTLIILLISFVFKSLSLKKFICEYNYDYTLKKAYELTLIGQFLNGITPFQSGGQPFQVYLLRKEKVRISDATNAMIKDFLSYQIALIIVGIVAILLSFKINVLTSNVYLNGLIFLGFIINLTVLIFLLLFSLTKKLGYKIAHGIIHFFFRFKIVKKVLKDENKIDDGLKHFYETGLELRKSKTIIFKCIALNIVYLVLTYIIPFVIFRSLGYNDVDIIESFVSVSFVMLISNFIPIPGATGGIEYSFLKFFGVFAEGALLSGAMLLWRFITYVLPMIIGFIILMFERGAKKNENRVIY